jgi:hypothetical protein
VTEAVPLIRVEERCQSCSKWRNPKEIIHMGNGGANICWQCYEKHIDALHALAGNPPKACGECGKTWAQFRSESPDGNVQMSVVMKDGIYQVLCPTPCADLYVRKRADMFGDTAFGYRKLKGTK